MDPNISYSRHSQTSRITQPVAIVSVNPSTNPPQATGLMRTREYVQIDISHHVGAIQVAPAVGQQWLIIRDRGIWKLDRQLPLGTPDSLVPMVEGQTRMGSSGPTEFFGSEINNNSPTNINDTMTTHDQVTMNAPVTANDQFTFNGPVTTNDDVTMNAPVTANDQFTLNGPVVANDEVTMNSFLTTNDDVTMNSQVNVNAPLRTLPSSSLDRPDAASVPAGSQIYDTTLNQPIWSDGTEWRWSVPKKVETISSAVALDSAFDYVIFVDAGGEPTLPSAVDNVRTYKFKNVTDSDITIMTILSETIDGNVDWPLAPDSTIEIVSDGNNWKVF